MNRFLKRTAAAAALLIPTGLVAGGGSSGIDASGGTHQYYLGTQGESCANSCMGENYICCTIDITVKRPT